MSEQKIDMKKAIESTVEQILESEKVEKSMPTSVPANGGEDKIKSGTPLMTEEELKAKAEKEAEEAKKAAEAAPAPAAEENVEKAKADDKDDKKKADKKDDKDDDCDEDDKKGKKKMPAFMKKSVEELAEVLDEEELELIKAWREESAPAAEEEITKSVEAAAPASTQGEDLAKAIEAQLEPLKKALDEKDTLIKSMSEKIEKMASQPAYDRRSISSLETLEKSGEAQASNELSKSQIAEKMLGMQLAGKGVTSHHITEFEATGNISDEVVKALVFKELKLN